jgi:Retron-type reverse transcriptase
MKVGKMQSKLAYWSQDQDERFDDKYNVVCSMEFLYHGWLNVKSNSGSNAPGVDGTTAEDYGENLNGRLKGLSRRLKSGSYKPKAVRRVHIPKGNGEKRPLGVPTIEDRVVQESLRLMMEPIFETDFSDYSFGFRPNRCCHDAISLVAGQMAPASSSYKHWILDLDIEGYFENVDHRTLMYAIQDRITDQKILDLIWKILKSGVVEQGTYRNSVTGTPQGGIISPLLANIYLDELDQWIRKWTGGSNRARAAQSRVGSDAVLSNMGQ